MKSQECHTAVLDANFPLYHSHHDAAEVGCIHCGTAVSVLTSRITDNAPGRGQFSLSCKTCKMLTYYDLAPELNGLDRHPRPATEDEKAFVLSIATYAEQITGDEYSLMWSEPGTSAQFSTQRPPLARLLNG